MVVWRNICEFGYTLFWKRYEGGCKGWKEGKGLHQAQLATIAPWSHRFLATYTGTEFERAANGHSQKPMRAFSAPDQVIFSKFTDFALQSILSLCGRKSPDHSFPALHGVFSMQT